MDKQIDLFSSVGIIIEGLLQKLQSMSLSPQIQALQHTIGIAITITILYKGYMVWAGKSNDPVRELALDLGKKAFILTIALGYGQWVNLSINAVRGIYEFAGGGSAFYNELDNLLNAFYAQVKHMIAWQQSKSALEAMSAALQALLIIVVMSICFLALTLELIFAIVACSVTNTFLIIVFPLAFLCFMFNQTKNAFTQWCSMLMSNTFQLLFLFMFLKASQSLILDIYKPPEKDGFIEFIGYTFEILIMSFLLVQVVKVLKELAQKMGGVTLDTAISGAGVMKAAGMGMAMAPNAIKSAASIGMVAAGVAVKGANMATKGVGMLANLAGANGHYGMGALANQGALGMAQSGLKNMGNAINNSSAMQGIKSTAKSLANRMRAQG